MSNFKWSRADRQEVAKTGKPAFVVGVCAPSGSEFMYWGPGDDAIVADITRLMVKHETLALHKMLAAEYRKNDPKGYRGDASRGSAVGRTTIMPPLSVPVSHVTFVRLWLDADGYDMLGTYFGLGEPLWYCWAPGLDLVLRGTSATRYLKSTFSTATHTKVRGLLGKPERRRGP